MAVSDLAYGYIYIYVEYVLIVFIIFIFKSVLSYLNVWKTVDTTKKT